MYDERPGRDHCMSIAANEITIVFKKKPRLYNNHEMFPVKHGLGRLSIHSAALRADSSMIGDLQILLAESSGIERRVPEQRLQVRPRNSDSFE
jgi:hypothetical protein